MDQKTFSLASGAVFSIVAIVHLLRILLNWPIVIGDWDVPMWVSWIGVVALAYLSFVGLGLALRK